jgi:hypothetical protein
VADAILSGKAKEIYPEHSEDDSIEFARAIKQVKKNNDGNS